MLCYSSSGNWYPILSPYFCLLSFTKTCNCFCCRHSGDHKKTLLTPTSDHIASLLWTIQGFHPTSRLTAYCSETSSLHVPLLTLLRHTGLPAVPPTCQVSSFLRTSCLKAPPPGVAWPPPSCHSDPMRHQLLKETARMSPSLSHPPHKNRSPVKAGPCLPAAEPPTHIEHIETWAGRHAEWESLTQVLGYPTSLLVLMEDAL